MRIPHSPVPWGDMGWNITDIPDLTGRTFLVTGATSGLGFETAKALAGAGGQVVLAGKGDGNIEKILGEAYAAGYNHYLTLEPHLSIAEANYGRTTPDLFAAAAAALRTILTRLGVQNQV